jgi:hypothetical protein
MELLESKTILSNKTPRSEYKEQTNCVGVSLTNVSTRFHDETSHEVRRVH